jgi:phage regulator Rha-like protein
MAKKPASEPLMPRIYAIRKRKVVLSSDLAALYGVQPKRLGEAVRRNADRFPDDFCFVLTREELANLKSQIAASSSSHGGTRKPPTAFTEHGALMAATILRSEKAVQMSIYLIRAFVQMREALMTNATILKRLAEIDRRLIEHDTVLREVVERLQPLLDAPDDEEEEEPKPKIGFHSGNR